MNSLDDFSDVVAGGINANSSSFDSLGLPASNPVSQNPTNLVQSDPSKTSNGGFIDSLESYLGSGVSAVKNGASSLIDGIENVGSSALNGVEDFGSAALHDTESAVKYAYSGVKTVVGDAVGGVEDVAGGIFNHMILWVVVVGGLIYLIASTNNFKVNASVPIV